MVRQLKVQALEGTGSFLQKIPFFSTLCKVIIGEYIRNLKDKSGLSWAKHFGRRLGMSVPVIFLLF
jgi:hypothetical protein